MVLSAIIDISERNKSMERLAEQHEELQRSNADLEQFAYVASHDLQEPLRMVATYTELLAERYKGQLDDKADKYISYTVDGAKRMQQLVKELLAYSRVSSQAGAPAIVESGAVVRDVLGGLKVAIEESRAEIICDELPAVRGDQAQLGQLFQNLIGNALKFRAERPPLIHIGAEKSNGKCLFRVEDNGIGIDSQYSDRVFQMFQRLHERGRYEGSGIGLAIAKKIVERHGGRIWFESEPQKGSTFYFTIPSA
jgi:light-regulated signal transduction histidine kinase (bacteriophytochrome)